MPTCQGGIYYHLYLQTGQKTLYYKEKSALLQALFILCLVSISRILFYAIIYLGLALLPGSSDSLCFAKATQSAILHTSKDFAVSPLFYNKIIPTLANWALAFRHQRHCSHLSDCSGRGLPATLSPDFSKDVCSDFPHCPLRDNAITQHETGRV